VNAARGDMGAFNLRNLGTGNTLVLLNGRRMVNAASYQTEEVGGSFVPVNTVNSNTIPVFGIDRVEVLRDGASAIYGADAVAGVVNNVIKSDFEGLSVRTKFSEFDHTSRSDQRLYFQWGKFFNDGSTNVNVLFDYYNRDRVNSQDDSHWGNADFRSRLDPNSTYVRNALALLDADDPGDAPHDISDLTAFRNNSANSLFGQYDLVSSASSAGLSGTFTDSRGEFETYPIGDPRCEWTLNATTCGATDGGNIDPVTGDAGTYRYNLNANRDLVSDLKRANLFVFINHTLANGLESFTELGYYDSDTNLNRHPSAPFSTVKLRVGAENYYNPFGPCGSPNRLDAALIPDVPCEGLVLEIDNYRFAQLPRVVDNDGETWRLLQGFRGAIQEWDWESAVLWSKAQKKDITHNRVSNLLIQEALEDSTAAAYNPFSGGVNSNIERALVDVQRINETELALIDFKVSRNDVFDAPGGPVGVLLGAEYRDEKFSDDRDPRLDGTIVFTDFQGDTYPFVSDVVNSSPTPDSSGSRNVLSVFSELQIPVLDTVDVQLALRFEDFSDVGSTTVGKFAVGWQPIPQLLFRGSWNEAFRAPNLVTINEEIVARQNTRNDYACVYAAENGGDPGQDIIDCRNSTQRIAQGSTLLKPEESTNYSFGVVVEPLPDLTFTLDFWSIEKEDTIGLFGEENHTILDLVYRLEHGTADCSTLQANPSVSREPDLEPDEEAVYLAAGICPAGLIEFIDDRYTNLDKRTVKGMDLGIYYDVDTDFGRFSVRYVGSFLDEYEQEPGGDAQVLVDAQNSGQLPASIPVTGFADLVRRDGNPEKKQTLRASWRKGPWGASLSGLQ
ncbi:MAG: TonB-dependent receptor, partial [Gammaproteobacteria bacterium]|nr:TonB-dependent receptor [Gammaproteobacteria bacterium]